MAGAKQSVSFQIQEDAVQMLEDAVKRYGLPDVNKALRCLLDYAATDGDWDAIFGEIRCTRCGGRKAWPKESAA